MNKIDKDTGTTRGPFPLSVSGLLRVPTSGGGWSALERAWGAKGLIKVQGSQAKGPSAEAQEARLCCSRLSGLATAEGTWALRPSPRHPDVTTWKGAFTEPCAH